MRDNDVYGSGEFPSISPSSYSTRQNVIGSTGAIDQNAIASTGDTGSLLSSLILIGGAAIGLHFLGEWFGDDGGKP
jgi:hypothetical protein